MIAKLVFKLPEEEPEFDAATNGAKYKRKLDDIWSYVFRPHFKHGYTGTHATDLNAYNGSGSDGPSIIEMLADRFQDIMRDSE